jgi:hypothetical protein
MESTSQIPAMPQNVLKQFSKPSGKNNMPILALFAVLVIVAGVGGGFLMSKGGVMGSSTTAPEVPGSKKSATEAGVADESTFKDSATGVLKVGGVKGEGTHHLERDGGPSQNVYLTSTVIDLESFVGKKVQIWGQTISAREAGWLMDVGKVKVVE